MKSAISVVVIAFLAWAAYVGIEQPSLAGQATENAAKADNTENLEPYLEDSVPALVAQIASDKTPYILKRRAMVRVVTQYPDEAPDALIRFLDHSGAHLNEYTGHLLFQLGKPNSKTDELIDRIRKGRKRTMEQKIAFAHALSWPGNNAAIPILQQMIDEKWYTANEARLCIARIQDAKGPDALLKLPYYVSGPGHDYQSSVHYAQRAGEILRAMADPKTNDVLLKDGNPRQALSLWGQEGLYALAWPGNTALADAYLKVQNPCRKFHIAAARTRDERCLKVIRDRFEKEAADFLEATPETPNLVWFRWMLIAGVESANAETAPTLTKLLKKAEEMREAAEADLRARIESGDPLLRMKQPNTDPAHFVREIILKGLCIHPNPQARAIVEPYLTDERRGYLVGLAMLRAGHAEGLQYLLDYWSWYSHRDEPAEAFLLFTAADVLPHSTYHHTKENIDKAKAWYEKHKDSRPVRDRITLINKSGLSEALAEPLKLWQSG